MTHWKRDADALGLFGDFPPIWVCSPHGTRVKQRSAPTFDCAEADRCSCTWVKITSRVVVYDQVTYDGTFPLAWLEEDEYVRNAGDGTGACVIVSPSRELRVEVGDTIEVRRGS